MPKNILLSVHNKNTSKLIYISGVFFFGIRIPSVNIHWSLESSKEAGGDSESVYKCRMELR